MNRARRPNAHLDVGEVERWCRPGPDAQRLLDRAMERFTLSARSYHRLLKVARTIADLAGSDAIDVSHMSEAIALRCLDRKPI